MMKQQDSYYYRGTLALNNMGVSMLERGQYKCAMRTLNDAVKAMTALAEQQRNVTCMQDMEKKMQRAVQRHAAASSSSSDSMRRRRTTDITVLCYHQTAAGEHRSMFESLLKRGLTTASSTTVIRMEEEIQCCPAGLHLISREEADVQMAMVMYNFAVAQMCSSRAATEEGETEKANMLRSGALRLFSRTLVFLSKYVTKKNAEEEEETTAFRGIFFGKVVLVSFLAVLCMWKTLQESGRKEESLEFMNKVVHLRDTLNDRMYNKNSGPSLYALQPAAAAAA